MKIIGEKDKIAVEYLIEDRNNNLGYARIWFGGTSLGSSKDLIYLKSYGS
jgi:hypothetical protein